jgi:growth factor-regulated tyrosine kinase substrate
MPLPDLGIVQEVRVCESCWSKSPKAKLAAASGNGDVLSKHDPSTPPVPTKRTLRTGGANYDADLQRAIALSLAESQNSGGHGYAPSQPGRILEGTDEAQSGRVDDEDEELRLAIEASLEESRRVRPSAPPNDDAPTTNYDQHATGYSVGAQRYEEPEYKPLPTYDLSPREAETMLTFAQTVDHAVAFGDQDFRRFPHVHALHEQAQALSGKLVRNIEEKTTKQRRFRALYSGFLQLTSPQKCCPRCRNS